MTALKAGRERVPVGNRMFVLTLSRNQWQRRLDCTEIIALRAARGPRSNEIKCQTQTVRRVCVCPFCVFIFFYAVFVMNVHPLAHFAALVEYIEVVEKLEERNLNLGTPNKW